MQWIKTSERLPQVEKSFKFLSCDVPAYNSKTKKLYKLAYYHHQQNVWYDTDTSEEIKVTHWLEITPPTEGE